MRFHTLSRRVAATLVAKRGLATKTTTVRTLTASANLWSSTKTEHEKLMVRMSIQKLLEAANDNNDGDESPNEEKLYEVERSLLAVKVSGCLCKKYVYHFSVSHVFALIHSFSLRKARLEEAQSCIGDCHDDANNIIDELQTADIALEQAGAAIVEFLEASRDIGEAQEDRLKDVRRDYVTHFKSLRRQLEELVQQQHGVKHDAR